MAYRFKFNETVEDGAQRILNEQVHRALTELRDNADPAEAVHQTRKCLKRCRALIRLVRSGLPPREFHALDRMFRAIANDLSQTRDSDIIAETIDKLRPHATPKTLAALSRVEASLAKGRARATKNRGAIERAIAELEIAITAIQRLALKFGDFDVIEKGLAAEMRRARRQYVKAYAGDCEDDFHDWRKTAQRHWRQMQLLVRAEPTLIAARIETARALSQILGENQDLAILKTRMAAVPVVKTGAADLAAVADLIDARQRALQIAAAPLGATLFAEHPVRFARRLRDHWKESKRLEKEAKARPEPDTA